MANPTLTLSFRHSYAVIFFSRVTYKALLGEPENRPRDLTDWWDVPTLVQCSVENKNSYFIQVRNTIPIYQSRIERQITIPPI